MILSETNLSELVGIIAAIGLILPTLQSFIQRPTWSAKTKSLLTVGLAVVGGLVAYVATNGITLESPTAIVTWIVGVYLASVTFYHGLLKPTGVAPAIEAGTSPATDETLDDTVPDPDDVPGAVVPVEPVPAGGFNDGAGSPDGLDDIAPEHAK